MTEQRNRHVSATMGGFTPSFDCVLQDVGLVGAAVFGRIWRYCQGYRHVCDASIETISGELNISTRTTLRWTKKLCKLGYLEDLTPDLRNKPHTYRDTGKVSLQVQVVAVTESHTIREKMPVGVTLSHSAMTESHSDCDFKSHEETCKRQIKRQGEGASATPEPKPEKPIIPIPEKKPEPEKITAKHPAVQAFRSGTHRYPPKSWYETIAETIGNQEEDVARWARIVMAWVGTGYNPCNVKGMLDYWGKTYLPGENGGNGNSRDPPKETEPIIIHGMNRTPEWLK